MKKLSIVPFSATILIGLEYGYDQLKIEKKDVISFIQEYQQTLIKNKEIYLSVSISECIIVLSGQIEPHLKIGFINYPKFQLSHSVLKLEIEELLKQLMMHFKQNRVIIEYLDETVMLENSEHIDPRI